MRRRDFTKAAGTVATALVGIGSIGIAGTAQADHELGCDNGVETGFSTGQVCHTPAKKIEPDNPPTNYAYNQRVSMDAVCTAIGGGCLLLGAIALADMIPGDEAVVAAGCTMGGAECYWRDELGEFYSGADSFHLYNKTTSKGIGGSDAVLAIPTNW